MPDFRTVPEHVAIIMDGNGRWAERRHKNRSAGHYAGAEQAKKIVGAASALGIEYVTLYIFSTENWKRTAEETGYLMSLIKNHLRAEFAFYKKNKIRLLHLGDEAGLPEDIREEIRSAAAETADFTGTTLVMAINYGGRDEIDEDALSSSFDIPDLPDVDLLIRTGGEKRLSNFLLWHASYAELVFTDTLWPDYGEDEFYGHIEQFQKRTRRFGAVLA